MSARAAEDDALRPRAAQPEVASGGRYSTVAVLLHWLIAALIVLQVVLAGRMEGPGTPERFAVFQLHKSIGITVLFLSLARLGWRLTHPPPPLPAAMAPWERALARWTHAAFYLVMLGMPLTGWIIVSSSRVAVPTLLYGVIPWPNLPGLAELAPAAKKSWRLAGALGHGLIIKFAYGLVALHVAGALKHQVFGDAPVLARMVPGAQPGRWREPRLAAIVLGLMGVVLFGRVVQPPPPSPQASPAVAPAPRPVSPVAAPPAPSETASNSNAPAAASQKVAAAPAVATPARWIVAPGSRLEFESSWSGQSVRGRFDRWRADILFSPEALARSCVTVTVDVASVNTGDAQRDAALPTEDWFDSKAHPRAIFTARRFDKTGEGRFIAHGALQLRGVTRPLDVPFRLSVDGSRAQVDGAAALDRTAFGVGQGDFAATDQIPAKVTLDIKVKARLASGARASRP